jgi:hypothetical protein
MVASGACPRRPRFVCWPIRGPSPSAPRLWLVCEMGASGLFPNSGLNGCSVVNTFGDQEYSDYHLRWSICRSITVSVVWLDDDLHVEVPRAIEPISPTARSSSSGFPTRLGTGQPSYPVDSDGDDRGRLHEGQGCRRGGAARWLHQVLDWAHLDLVIANPIAGDGPGPARFVVWRDDRFDWIQRCGSWSDSELHRSLRSGGRVRRRSELLAGRQGSCATHYRSSFDPTCQVLGRTLPSARRWCALSEDAVQRSSVRVGIPKFRRGDASVNTDSRRQCAGRAVLPELTVAFQDLDWPLLACWFCVPCDGRRRRSPGPNGHCWSSSSKPLNEKAPLRSETERGHGVLGQYPQVVGAVSTPLYISAVHLSCTSQL